jgi:hypothetical protein
MEQVGTEILSSQKNRNLDCIFFLNFILPVCVFYIVWGLAIFNFGSVNPEIQSNFVFSRTQQSTQN